MVISELSCCCNFSVIKDVEVEWWFLGRVLTGSWRRSIKKGRSIRLIKKMACEQRGLFNVFGQLLLLPGVKPVKVFWVVLDGTMMKRSE